MLEDLFKGSERHTISFQFFNKKEVQAFGSPVLQFYQRESRKP